MITRLKLESMRVCATILLMACIGPNFAIALAVSRERNNVSLLQVYYFYEVITAKKPLLIIIWVLLFSTIGCKHQYLDPEADRYEILSRHLKIPASPFNYEHPALPDFFNNQFVRFQDNTPASNPITNWGATLGRVLFYDTRLSINHRISCASCHKQEFGFTDTAQFSTGFMGGFTKRHSMALVNAKYYSNGRFFWDERAASLEEQVLTPIQDQVEMGMRLDTLVARLQATEFYPILFQYAFGTGTITSENIAKALAQFVRSMVSYQSKYDVGRNLSPDREANFSNFTSEENRGKDIFMKSLPINCFGCHNTDVFIADNPRNNGTHADNKDVGIFIHTNDVLDLGKFKAPSLKNVALRGRYMDDGSIQGLSGVIDHYNQAILANPNLDPHIKDTLGKPARMHLSPAEVQALKAFLETLTDYEIIRDEKFRSPF